VDDNSNGEFYKEIPFRIRLESEFRQNEFHNYNNNNERLTPRSPRSPVSPRRKASVASITESYSSLKTKLESEMEYQSKYNIKMIQICIQGGFDTLLVIQESLRVQVPILILAVSLNSI
jgi:hypothetical protein